MQDAGETRLCEGGTLDVVWLSLSSQFAFGRITYPLWQFLVDD